LILGAKLRAARRRGARGAVMFIVAMTLAVLASIGLFALGSATTEIKTSGFERQNAQSHYLAEYGIIGAAQNTNSDTASVYMGMMLNAARRDTNCVSLPGVASTATRTSQACRRMGSDELSKLWPGSPGVAFSPKPLGPFPVNADFFVELTDPVQSQPPPGFDLKLGLCFAKLTVTSFGLTQPALNNPSTDLAALYGAEGIEMARARITAGPTRCGP